PFVLGHGRWPHGSDWLMEVAAGCYLPLLDAIDDAAARGGSPRITLDISPVLAGQLAAPAFRSEFEEYLRARISSARENRQEFAAANQPELAHLAEGWEGFYRDRLQQFERLNGDLVGALRALADQGHVTLITCAATHGYLPLLSREESIALQLRVAVTAPGGHGTATAFVRDPDSTMQVWSRDRGYPGDGSYLEFHKKHFPGGLRYWRVTDAKVDLGGKQLYEPARAQERVQAHAGHFVDLLRGVLTANPEGPHAVVCSPYDTELFGHW